MEKLVKLELLFSSKDNSVDGIIKAVEYALKKNQIHVVGEGANDCVHETLYAKVDKISGEGGSVLYENQPTMVSYKKSASNLFRSSDIIHIKHVGAFHIVVGKKKVYLYNPNNHSKFKIACSESGKKATSLTELYNYLNRSNIDYEVWRKCTDL